MHRSLTLLIAPLLFSTVIRADDGLRLDRTRESLTATWRYYTQVVDGLEVVGAGVIERVDPDGSVHEVFRDLVVPQPRVPRRMIAASDATHALPAGLLVEQRMLA